MTETLKYFLEAYLAIVPDGSIATALREFARFESPHRVLRLREELQYMMDPESEESRRALNESVRLLANYDLPLHMNPVRFLTTLWEQAQLVGPWEPFRKPYDVFISYVRQDEPAAKRIASELALAGFKVWYDDWEEQPASAAKARISHALRSADCVVCLLSKNAVASQWFNAELEALSKRRRAADVDAVFTVLDGTTPPFDLHDRPVVNVGPDWPSGLNVLLRTLEWFRSRKQLSRHLMPQPDRPVRAHTLEAFYRATNERFANLGRRRAGAYKDAVIGPGDDTAAALTLTELTEIVNDCRVTLRHLAGAAFPHEEGPQADVTRGSDGITLLDDSAGPAADLSLNYWRFTPEARLMHRSSLTEDSMVEASVGRVLAVEWALKDICMPLVFAQRMAVKLESVDELVVVYRWSGLQGRRLVSLTNRRYLVPSQCVSTRPAFERQVAVRHDSDLVPTAELLAKELIRLFQWEDYPEDRVGEEIRLILSGTFPR